LKIGIYSTKDLIGGASKAANRLYTSLNNLEYVTAKMHVAIKSIEDENVISVGPWKLFLLKVVSKIEKLILKICNSSDHIHHSLGIFGVIKSNEINSKNYDIINIHWINSGFLSIKTISNINKPVVITLHDSWFFCGCEHHPQSLNDLRYVNGYSSENKILKDSLIDINRIIWRLKKKMIHSNINIIAPSSWMFNMARRSSIFRDNKIIHIPNPLNTDIFKPLDKIKTKIDLGLDEHNKIVLFGVFGDPFQINNKGIDLLFSSLEKIKNHKFTCFCVGHDNKDYYIGNIKIKFLGNIFSENMMAKIYNIADVVVIPSRLENLTQMGTESLSCGIPVIAFDTGGNSDIIENQKNGILVEPFDIEKFASSIIEVLNWPKIKYKKISDFCREKAVSKWSFKKISSDYNNFFKKIVEEN